MALKRSTDIVRSRLKSGKLFSGGGDASSLLDSRDILSVKGTRQSVKAVSVCQPNSRRETLQPWRGAVDIRNEAWRRLDAPCSTFPDHAHSISTMVTPPGSRRAFLIDTLALVRRLEAQGLTPKQAEAITAVITEVLNESLENAAQSFAHKNDMQRSEMLQEAALEKFKGEVNSAQEHHFSALQRETERLRTDIDRMRSELRYEIDKVTAGQRLDLNLEKGRMREELANQNQETANLTNRLDREIHTLKTQLEAAKYDVIKYCIGTIVSVTAVGLGILRVVL